MGPTGADAMGSARRPLTRRAAVAGGVGLGVGISTLLLPPASAAESPGGSTQSASAPNTLSVDDTGLALAGHDVTLQVAVLTTAGTPVTSQVSLTLTVRRDDGSAGGAGSAVAGTVIDGEERSERTVQTSDGAATLSIAFPASGTYLLTLSTTPALGAHPDGVTLLWQHTA
jgi:hypothetical protein